MARNPRRTGISYIANKNSRSATFFKRRAGLYKSAADLSTLTGARIAIVLQAENGKMSSFGTPSADAIVNSFLSADAAQVDPFVNQVQKEKITILQNEVFKAEKEKAMEEKRAKEKTARVKELVATSRKAKLVYSKVEDLNGEELSELLLDLTQVQREISGRLRPPQQPSNQQPSNQLEVGGSGDPLLRWLSSSPSHPKNPLPPRRLPWTTQIQPSLHLSKSPLSLPQPSWPQATLLNHQTLLQTAQAPPSTPLLQHGLMPQHPLMVQAQMFSSSNEAHQHRLHINSNILQPSSQSSLISMLQPPPSSLVSINELPPPSLLQQPPTLLPPEPELHPATHPENHTSIGDFTASDHPFPIHQWPSPIQSDGPYFDAFMD